MKTKIRRSYHFGLGLDDGVEIDDVIAHLKERKRIFNGNGFTRVLVQEDNDYTGENCVYLVGERDETDEEEQRRVERERLTKTVEQQIILRCLKSLSQREAVELWRKAKKL